MKYLTLLICIFFSSSLLSQTKNKFDSITIVLENIYKNDQAPRLAVDSISKKFGYSSDVVQKYWAEIAHTDSINILNVSKIIDTYGWLGKEEISEKANAALYLVIQHSDIKTREKYLPIMQKAVEDKKASAKDFAHLFDRTLMDKGKFQIYGTQLTGGSESDLSLYPINDEPNVNKRRKEIGLQPIEDYMKRFFLQYKAPSKDQYKHKIVLIGFVLEHDNKPVENATILLGDNSKIIATTDSKGRFRIILDKKFATWAFLIKRDGLKTLSFCLDPNKDVYVNGYILSK